MNVLARIAATLLISLLIMGCKKDKDAPAAEDKFNSYDRKPLLDNIGNNIIITSYNDFQNITEALHTASEIFAADPTETNLASLQTAWKNAEYSWKRCELFKIGPATSVGLGYYTSIDFKPTNYTAIDNAINTTSTIDNAYVNSKGASVKGLPALEYLLFSSTGDNTFIVGQYTGASDAASKRRAYLQALCENLHSKASALYQEWIPAGNNYITTFIQSDGRDINSSLSVLVNQLIYLTEEIKNKKIGIPAGVGGQNKPQPEATEASLSKASLNNILNNIQSMENTFHGKGSKGDLKGLDDLLDYTESANSTPTLSSKINTQFAAIYEAYNAIPDPLESAVTTDNEKVMKLYSLMKDLVATLKVDVAGRLGILLTVSDNDGD